MYMRCIYYHWVQFNLGVYGSVVFKALCYKPEGLRPAGFNEQSAPEAVWTYCKIHHEPLAVKGLCTELSELHKDLSN
jgi:hypothetical protein